MAKVLVTGANGFIGTNLVEALVAQGDEVTCLVRKTSRLERLRPLGGKVVYGDVTDRESLAGPIVGQEVVYHLAGRTKALRAEQFHRVNHEGTRNVARTCAEKTSPPVLVVVSSLAAAGPAIDGRPRTEADPPEPVSNYGRSKLAGEAAVRKLADRVPVTIVRPPITLGPADVDGLKMFKAIAVTGVHMVPSFSQHKFSVIDARDLAELLILAARRGARIPAAKTDDLSDAQGVYYAACNEHPTYAGLGRMVADALGRRWVIALPTAMPVGGTVAACAQMIGWICRRPRYLSVDKAREISAGSWVCSHQAAKDQLGFSVTTPLAERLRQTAQWYRDEGWL